MAKQQKLRRFNYSVVIATTLGKLEAEVADYLNAGWKTTGGLIVDTLHNEEWYCQAMVIDFEKKDVQDNARVLLNELGKSST